MAGEPLAGGSGGEQALERLKDAAAWAATLPVLLTPVSNPDLFWHLAAAARTVSEGRLPRWDVWSFTRMGSPWVDFEWLVQLVFLGVHSAAGWAGLFALKVLLLAVCGAALWGLAGLHSRGGARRLALLLWAALSLPRSELKPELFSAALFTLELWALEAGRLGLLPRASPGRWALVSAAFFCAWANLHPGFPMGFALLVAYSPGRERGEVRRLLAALAGGAAGTLLNPYGWRIYEVLLDHARWLGLLSRHILEWTPTPLSLAYSPMLLLAAALTAAWVFRWRAAGVPPAAHLLLALVFGVEGFLHRRQALFFIPVGLLSLLECLSRLGPLRGGGAASRWSLLPAAAVWGLYAAFTFHTVIPRLRPPKVFDDALLPVRAADFIERNLETLSHRRFFNNWGWGGYLAYRFEPELRVFMDGRYLFHPLLDEMSRAYAHPAAWQDFLDRYGIEWAVVFNDTQPMDVVERLPGGGTVRYRAPHWKAYMPSLKWAVVYADPAALVFARRGALPDAWISANERRRPR